MFAIGLVEVMNNFIKNISIIFTILGFSYWTATCSFAKQVQNNTKPKFELYYIGETKHHFLIQEKVLILTCRDFYSFSRVDPELKLVIHI